MKKLILLLAASMGVMAQQTNILDTLYYPGPGTPPAKFNGSLDISWITFTACDGSVIPTGHQNFQVKNGAINIWLQKYVASSCGVIYTVRYALTNGLQQTEYWNVPASSPTNLGGVRVPPQPPPPVPYIQSINSMSPSAFFLAAGANITLTPSGGNTITIASTGGGSGAFSALTGGTNTSAAMIVGTGASLGASGAGTIAATAVPVGGVSGLGTGVGAALAANVSGTGNICLSSGSSCAGTGSNATHYLSFSATPSWTATSGSGDFFCFHTTTDCDTALTANVTSITFSGGSPGETIGATFIQAAGCSSGGSGCFTVSTPSGFDACQVGQIANAVTLMSWWWDGNVGHRISCTTTGPGQSPLSAAPGTPPSGQVFSWCDSTSKICRAVNDAGTILAMEKELAAGCIRQAGGANTVDTCAASLAGSATPGTSATISGPAQIFTCTSTCTITVPVPAINVQYCVMNDDNVSTVITLAAVGSGVRYENTARTAYGTAGTGTLVSGGVVKDSICIIGRDSTHYLTVSFNGTWVAN